MITVKELKITSMKITFERSCAALILSSPRKQFITNFAIQSQAIKKFSWLAASGKSSERFGFWSCKSTGTLSALSYRSAICNVSWDFPAYQESCVTSVKYCVYVDYWAFFVVLNTDSGPYQLNNLLLFTSNIIQLKLWVKLLLWRPWEPYYQTLT